jgi:predicted porin
MASATLTAAAAASVQSTVTLGGAVDLSGRYVKNDGRDCRVSLTQDGINNSQLYFVGTEDLRGGLRAAST